MYVCMYDMQDYCHLPSHWNADKTLSDWLKENNVPGMYGIDTRALTKKLRVHGSMKVCTSVCTYECIYAYIYMHILPFLLHTHKQKDAGALWMEATTTNRSRRVGEEEESSCRCRSARDSSSGSCNSSR